MSVVGFDVGNLTCFVAVAKQGGIETVANEYSSRSTPSYVGFTEKIRVIGQDAKNIQLTGSNSKNVVFNFKRLLGRKCSDAFVKEYCQNLPYKIVPIGDSDDIGVLVKYQGKEQTFSITQIMAAQLVKLKEIAETNLKRKVVDCVIAVPSFYTDIERRAMLDAARIADLNCLRLMNDTTATGLCYGFYKKDLPEAGQAARNVVFVDFGHSSLQVCLVAFNKGQMKVLSVTNDPYIGGMLIDKLLTDQVAKDLETRYKIKPLNQVRPYLKLLGEVEKLKILMSANKTKLPLNIECFMDDIDISAHLCRDEMEEICKKLFDRVQAKFEEVIQISGIDRKDIHSVEVVGGSSRVALFKDLVKSVFGLEPSTTLNADEAVSRGCALQCAMLSSVSQVQTKWTITDVCQFPITLNWKPFSEKDGSIDVFPYNHVYPATKMLTFYRRDAFDINAQYTYPQNIPYPNSHIGNFVIHDVNPAADGSPAKVKVKVHLNKHGIFNVSEALQVEKYEEAVEAMDTTPDAAKSPSKDGEEQPPGEAAPAENGEQAAQPAAADQSQPMDTGDPTADPDQPKEPPTEQGAKKKTKIKNINLPVKHNVASISNDALTDLKRAENQFQIAVQFEKEKADAKNALEEYILDLRRQLSEELEDFIKEDDADQLRSTLTQGEDWLFEDGFDCEKHVYIEKLAEMKKLGAPIITRKIEFETRPRVLESFGARIQFFSKFLDAYSQKSPEYEHIPKDDVKKVQKAVEEKRKWFDDACNKLNKLQKCDDPPILVSAIREQMKSLDNIGNPVVNKPKPKVEPPPQPKDKKGGEAKKGETDEKSGDASENNGDHQMETEPPAAENGSVDPNSEVD